MKSALLVFTLFAPFFFPVAFVSFCTLVSAIFSSFTPLAVGILLDALYFSPHAFRFPLYTALGAAIALSSLFVRRFVETSIMR